MNVFPPRCSHGRILLACPEDCPEQDALLKQYQDALHAWEARLRKNTKDMIKRGSGPHGERQVTTIGERIADAIMAQHHTCDEVHPGDACCSDTCAELAVDDAHDILCTHDEDATIARRLGQVPAVEPPYITPALRRAYLTGFRKALE